MSYLYPANPTTEEFLVAHCHRHGPERPIATPAGELVDRGIGSQSASETAEEYGY